MGPPTSGLTWLEVESWDLAEFLIWFHSGVDCHCRLRGSVRSTRCQTCDHCCALLRGVVACVDRIPRSSSDQVVLSDVSRDGLLVHPYLGCLWLSSPGMLEVVDGVCCRRSLQRFVSGTNCLVTAEGFDCLASQVARFAELLVSSLFPLFFEVDPFVFESVLAFEFPYFRVAVTVPGRFPRFVPRRFVVSGVTVVVPWLISSGRRRNAVGTICPI